MKNYPKYIVDAFAKDDWYNALGKGVPLGNHFTIDKNGKTHHFDGDGNPMARNEVREYQDMCSIGASEAHWRLFEFEMSDR